jgi:hypothetical protein
MKVDVAISALKNHEDPGVRGLARHIKENIDRRDKFLEIAQEHLQQLRVDICYLKFDLDCTRKERDELADRLQ